MPGFTEVFCNPGVVGHSVDDVSAVFVKVTVNVFWVKISIFRFFRILLAELSRHTVIPCLKPAEVLKMEEISCKRRLPQFLHQSFLFVVFEIHT